MVIEGKGIGGRTRATMQLSSNVRFTLEYDQNQKDKIHEKCSMEVCLKQI